MMKRLRSLRLFFAGIACAAGGYLAWVWSAVLAEMVEVASTSPIAQHAAIDGVFLAIMLGVVFFRMRRFRREMAAHLFALASQNNKTAVGLQGIARALVTHGILGEKVPENAPPSATSGGGPPTALLH